MGQNCSCFEKEIDTSEKNVEDLLKSKSNQNEIVNNYIYNNQSIKVKQIQRNSSLLNLEENNIEEMSMLPNTMNKKNENQNEDKEENEIENNKGKKNFIDNSDKEKINLLIKNISIYISRKNFIEKEKNSLRIFSENMFNQLILCEGIEKLMNLRKNIKIIFEQNGWKDFYENCPILYKDLPKSKFEKYEIKNKEKNSNNYKNFENINLYQTENNNLFGKTYFEKKLFIRPENEKNNLNKKIKLDNSNLNTNIDFIDNFNKKRSYIYIGHVNKFGEKHGKGILYYLDGCSMEEGIYFNDRLIGWSRIIFGNGTFIDSKN
jgi:hypothetical protein